MVRSKHHQRGDTSLERRMPDRRGERRFDRGQRRRERSAAAGADSLGRALAPCMIPIDASGGHGRP
jgi:hypothetical protein